jgi:hypothetical protein
MRHLTPDELLDLAEDAATPAAAEQANAHVASCARCAEELKHAQAGLAFAREPLNADVPEPSPLFWDHLSARIREGVAAEPPPRAGSWFDLPWGWRALIPVAAAAVVTVAVSLELGSGGKQPASRVATTAPAPVEHRAEGVDASQATDDPALALLADLAGDFEWDDVADAGLMAGSGAIDRAMSELNEDERVELHRLLNEELKQWKTPGA